jgi:NADH dehydrogenase FAD-containing subunit
VASQRGGGRGDHTLTAAPVEARLLRRLVLIGAGRAHLYVLRALAKPLVRGLEIVLVAPEREHYSAAMQSGLLRGTYEPGEAKIDVGSLAARGGARFVEAAVDRIALGERIVHARGERIPFDLCSIDAEGEPEGIELPGVASHAVLLRPTSALPRVRERIEATLAQASRPLDCVIVGGGTRGVETAFALQRLIDRTKHGGVVTIVDEAPTILADAAPCRDMARHALERAGVCFVLGTGVAEVCEDRVLLAAGGSLPASLVLWAAAGRAADVITASGLPHDPRGRLLVDEAMRAINGSPVWAAGDCVSSASDGASHGDYGGEQGRNLERALRAALVAPSSPIKAQQTAARCLLDTGDGRAIIQWGRVHGRFRMAGWLKRRLDRRFVSSFARP